MLRIVSASNPKFKAALRLHAARGRKDQSRFLIHGAREISRAAAARIEFDELFVCSDHGSPETRAAAEGLASQTGASLIDLAPPLLAQLTYGDRPEAYLATARRPDTALSQLQRPSSGLVLVVEAIEKPGNLGALFRSADGAGVSAVILASPRTDLFHPNAIRASLGTVFAVPAAVDESSAVREWLSQQGLKIWLADPVADRDYTELDLARGSAVVLGSEAFGISPAWQGCPAFRVPMRGIADSLNVSVTAAVIAYEGLRQRRPENGKSCGC